VESLLKNPAKSRGERTENKNYEVLFEEIKSMFSEIDNHIGDCKRYNEAKTRRKYERRIE
jgi:hypothetical protein